MNVERSNFTIVSADEGDVTATAEESWNLAEHLIGFYSLDVELLKFVDDLVCLDKAFSYEEKIRVLLPLNYDSLAWLFEPND